MTWQQLVQTGEKMFVSNEGHSVTAMVGLLGALSRLGRIPGDADEKDFRRLSFILQDCVIRRLAIIKSEDSRLQLHYLVCQLLA